MSDGIDASKILCDGQKKKEEKKRNMAQRGNEGQWDTMKDNRGQRDIDVAQLRKS